MLNFLQIDSKFAQHRQNQSPPRPKKANGKKLFHSHCSSYYYCISS